MGSQEKSVKVMRNQEILLKLEESQEKSGNFISQTYSVMPNCGDISILNVHWLSLKHTHIV